MKVKTTYRKSGKASVILTIAIMLFFFGCYEIKTVYQPTEAHINSSFEAIIVATGLENEKVGGDSARIAHLGVMLPEGWVVQEPVKLIKVSLGGEFDDTDSVWYDESHVNSLNSHSDIDSLIPPEGYYWWGGSTLNTVDWYDLDTAYCVATILTSDTIGEFFLVYAIGDGGTDIDGQGVSEKMPIAVSDGRGGNRINDKVALTEFTCYPNPSNGFINIDIENVSRDASLKIINTNGQTVLRKNDLSEANHIDLSELHNGVYHVLFEDRGIQSVQRLVMQK